jgi:2-polyprenyl-3-methyl-5-hydroxy-6-metoxy-1,4-benzoquinol methylase
MKKIIEKIIYAFGINGSFYNVTNELNSLQSSLPDDFQNRDVVDIGCGDGKISLKLIPILRPKSFKGIDASRSLIKTAQNNGISAETLDVESQAISGDLGIMWGVLHHFENPAQTLEKLSKEFNSFIIRESIDDKRIFELGHKLSRTKLMDIIKEAKLEPMKIVEIKDNDSVILFIESKR